MTIHAGICDAEMSEAQRQAAAAMARRLADRFKQMDRLFSYEWFYGACGLDPWGDLITGDLITGDPLGAKGFRPPA